MKKRNKSEETDIRKVYDDIRYETELLERKMARRYYYVDDKVKSLWHWFVDTRIMTKDEFTSVLADMLKEPRDVILESVNRLFPESKDEM